MSGTTAVATEPPSVAPDLPRVAVLGVRHHGPGSARSVERALDALVPDVVVIEGPPELDALVPLAADPDLVPPVAALVYAVDTPRRAAFYPFAEFSPEWVALRWALRHDVPVRFADLPAAHLLADEPEPAEAAEPAEADPPDRAAIGTVVRRTDPVAELAVAAGYDDPERWWEDAVEQRRADSGGSPLAHFDALRAAMAAVRERQPRTEDDRREAFMRGVIRAELRAGRRIAVVCGAFHAPVLHPDAFPTAASDAALTTRLPKVKVAATWAPWTAQRLSFASGYGAGITSPGWYRHLFVTPEAEVVPAWFARVARALREQDLECAPATAVEAVRLADALAAVRGRPSVGLTELTDAARTVLTEGSDLPLQLIERTLVIGEALGRVPASTPMVPLARDLAERQRALRLPVAATARTVELDLRRESQLARSVLLHRLELLGVPWGAQVATGRSAGTFKEAWELAWTPALAVAVIEASLYGTTVADAATAKAEEQAARAPDLATLGRLVEQCLPADLPEALGAVVAALGERTAQQHDTAALLSVVLPLARTHRYGDVRGTDTTALVELLETVVVRVAVGLRTACASLDDDAAAAMLAAVEAADEGVVLLDLPPLKEPWHRALASVADDETVHGVVAGRANRLLLDHGLLERGTAAARLGRRLSAASSARDAAAWLDGFLTGDALVLLHDDVVLGLVDRWLTEAPEEVFEDLLPLVRRTFSRFQHAERREIGRRLRGEGGAEVEPMPFDVGLAAPAIATVLRLLKAGTTP